MERGRHRIVLKWILKWDVEEGLDCSGSGYEHVADVCKCGNEPSRSIKCGKYINVVTLT
jgi:hypothetical protein